MRSKLLSERDGRVFAVVFETGEDPMRGLMSFARERKLAASGFTAIGAFSRATLGYFNWERKDYDRIAVDDQVEVLALLGDVTLEGEEHKLHAHVVLGMRDGAARGGHLLAATVRPTLEVVLSETPGHLCRRHDPESGLALIRI